MYFLKPLYAATLLASACHAAPWPANVQLRDGEKTSFKVGRPGLKGKHRSGREELERTMRKYGMSTTDCDHVGDSGIPVDDSVTDAAAGGDSGEVEATPEANDARFLSTVSVGGQNFQLDFDTGSSDTWMFSTLQKQNQLAGHAVFNANQSRTFKPIQGGKFDISYGDNSFARGIVGTDTVKVGGVTATGMAVGVSTAVSSAFIQDKALDGLMGLAFDKLNTVAINGKKSPQKTFFSSIKDQLKTPVFAADLEKDNTGTYEFGNIDDTQFKGQLTNVPVNSAQGFWQVDSAFFTVDGKKTVNNKGTPAIADTGTTLMLVDTKVATTYYKQVQGAKFSKQQGGFIYPCDANLPDFGVALGDYEAVIPGSEITFIKAGGGQCFGGVQSNGGATLQIYGDTMFKTQYVVFDEDNEQLQIAPKA